jgi:hypothetical protein
MVKSLRKSASITIIDSAAITTGGRKETTETYLTEGKELKVESLESNI